MPIIYLITAPSGKKYVGSTKSAISMRKQSHRSMYNEWKAGKKRKTCKSFDLFDEAGFDACEFSVIEKLPKDITKMALLEREKHYFLTLENLVNRQCPLRTREEHLAYMREWHIANGHTEERREKAKLRQRAYRLKKKLERITLDCPDQTMVDLEPLLEDTISHS